MSKFNDFMLQWGVDKFLHFMVGAAGFAITESWIVLGILAFVDPSGMLNLSCALKRTKYVKLLTYLLRLA